MADDPIPESEEDETERADADSKRLADIHDEALDLFDAVALPQMEDRALRLRDRRFVDVEGAQWEGEWAEQFENSPRPELDKITKNGEKIEGDYRENRVSVNFLPVDSKDTETAGTMNDMFRADMHTFKSQQAYDNAFGEGWKGGMGAWRMTTDFADPYDPDNDHQRVNPGVVIPDADQSVFFVNSTLYDGSDATACFVLSAMPMNVAKAEYGNDIPDDWDSLRLRWQYDWYTPDVVKLAEYYVVEENPDEVLIFTLPTTDEEQRYFKSEIEEGEAAKLRGQGWKMRKRPWKRRRIHKYLLCGSCVLKDYGYIAGDQIPIVPFYARVSWIDGVPRVRGYVRKKIDAQRTLNAAVAHLTEIDSLAPYEVPIVLAEQMTPEIMQEWADGNIKRHPFRRLLAIRDEGGNIIQSGPVGKIEAPQVPPVTAVRLQFSVQILSDDDDSASQVRANVSADAMDIAADRVDSVSRIYLDNFQLSMQRCGEIYRSMAREIYYEPGRKVQTRSMDGAQGESELMEAVVDPATGVYRIRNDLTRGNFTVEASVQESSVTKRQKAMRQGLELGKAFIEAQSPQDALAALYTAAENIDGAGIDDLKEFYRKRSIGIGATKPTKEEQALIDQASQEEQQPSPADQVLTAQATKLAADAKQSEAAALEKGASAMLKAAQAEAVGGPASQPETPSGLHSVEVGEKEASAELKRAQARKIDHEIGEKRVRLGHEMEMDRRGQDLAERGSAEDE